MHIRAAEFFSGDVLSRCGFDQWRAAEKDRALVLHDDGFIAHRRNIGAAGRARSHDRGDLIDPFGRHDGLVVEDAPEVLAIRKDFRLERKKRAAGVDQVNARKMVLQSDLLRAKMLLYRDREVRAALDRRVVGDDDGAMSLDRSHAGDDSRAGSLVLVHAVRRKSAEFEERRPGIEQSGDAFAHEHLAARRVTLQRFVAAALLCRAELLAEARQPAPAWLHDWLVCLRLPTFPPNVVDDVFGRRAGLEDFADSEFFELWECPGPE